jgi:glycosyltransferase involved in cell wall biosynthesis
MTNNNPLISVMMPTYNNAKYIKQAIESIYAQNYDNIEIIVVDDGSTDNTKEIVQQYKDIKYFYTEHKGIPFARNLVLEKSKGEYIAVLDSDDYWLPNKLNTQMQYFKDHPDCEIVFTKYKNIIDNENIKNDRITINEKNREEKEKKHLPTALIKKSLFEKHGVFDEDFQTGEDSELIFRFEKNGVNLNHFIDTNLYIRRLHGNNITLIVRQKYSKYLMKVLRKGVLKK